MGGYARAIGYLSGVLGQHRLAAVHRESGNRRRYGRKHAGKTVLRRKMGDGISCPEPDRAVNVGVECLLIRIQGGQAVLFIEMQPVSRRGTGWSGDVDSRIRPSP